MPAPAAYTEGTLAAFMLTDLSEVGEALGWVAADLDEAVNDTLLAYGATDVADATDIPRVRAIARMMAWRAAAAALVARYNFQDPDGQYTRNQMLAGARARLAMLEAEAARYLPGAGAVVTPVGRRYDPYTPLTQSEHTGLFG